MKFLGPESRGSVAAQTYSRNQHCQYIRERLFPSETPSARRTLAWSYLPTASQAWSGLTDEQREAWTAWALLDRRPNSLGISGPRTGEQAFVQVNVRRQWASLALIDEPPPRVTFGEWSFAFTWASLSVMDVTWSTPGAPAGTELLLQGSYPVSAGRSRWYTWKLFYRIGVFGAQPVNIFAGYSIDFGAPVSGKRVFLRGWLQDAECGSVSTRLVSSAVGP